MPVELRKRKAPAAPPAPPPKRQSKVAKATAKVKEVVKGKAAAATKPAKDIKATKANGTAHAAKPVVGDVIALDGFGGDVETNDGQKTSLKALVDASKGGVILFTYPKASTPGCTAQARLFRDAFAPLTKTGLAIYGLSTDSPKANTTFKDKQKLPYPLLCDPAATLIDAIGLKKAPKGTTRGVFVVDKDGKVLAAEPGGPAATVDVVKKLVAGAGGDVEAVEEAAPPVDAPAPATEVAAPANGEAADEAKPEVEAEKKAE